MSQPVSYNSFNEATTSRRFTGFPLNSTLVSSYTPDTIRSIISQAAAGQPYCMFLSFSSKENVRKEIVSL